MRSVSRPSQRHGLPYDRQGGFALRISALPHFCRKSPVCLPSTVYRAGSQPRGIGPRIFARSRHATHRAIADPRRFDLPRSMQSALHSLDRCGLSRSRRPARISQQPGGASRQTGVDQYDRRSAAVASRRAKTAFRKHLARHTPLTQRAAICCAQMRLSGAPHASHLSLPARDLGFGKAPAPIQEFLARMIEARRTAISIAACISAGPAHRLHSREYRNHRGARPRALAPRRPRCGAKCVRRFTISSCRLNVQGCNLHFGSYALDARDRLGP
jgi:hypothetical protein